MPGATCTLCNVRCLLTQLNLRAKCQRIGWAGHWEPVLIRVELLN